MYSVQRGCVDYDGFCLRKVKGEGRGDRGMTTFEKKSSAAEVR